jgi:selenoprotein W-related protein
MKEFGIVAELIESGGGVYEIVVNNNLIFSKKQLNRFPNEGEIVELMRSR